MSPNINGSPGPTKGGSAAMMIPGGSTPNFAVSYDSSFSTATPSGAAMSQAIIDMCEYDLTRLSMLFGGIRPPSANLPIKVQLIVGSGGASNDGVSNIWCNCSSSTNPLELPSLVVAERGDPDECPGQRMVGWIQQRRGALACVCADPVSFSGVAMVDYVKEYNWTFQ
jgi:hypothetical protein